MKKRLFAIAFILMVAIAFTQNVDQYPGLADAMLQATTESDDGMRLALYDEIAQKYGFAEKKETTSTLSGETSRSKWLFDQKVDPLNDVNRYTFFLEADSGTNEYGKKPVLIIRFADKETEAFINWDTYLGNDTDNYKYDSKYVTIRVDSTPPSTTLWGNSTDDKASFCPWENALDLVRKIGQGTKLVARCTPYGDSPITAVFDIRGFKDISMPYNRATGWWK